MFRLTRRAVQAVEQEPRAADRVGGFLGAAWFRTQEDCRAEWVPTASITAGVHVFRRHDALQWTIHAAPKLGTVRCADTRQWFVAD